MLLIHYVIMGLIYENVLIHILIHISVSIFIFLTTMLFLFE